MQFKYFVQAIVVGVFAGLVEVSPAGGVPCSQKSCEPPARVVRFCSQFQNGRADSVALMSTRGNLAKKMTCGALVQTLEHGHYVHFTVFATMSE